MSTHVQSEFSSRGIKSTLSGPGPSSLRSLDMTKVTLMENKLAALNLLIGFAHAVPPSSSVQFTDTKSGEQTIGSPLSFQLAAMDFNFIVHRNLSAIPDCEPTEDFILGLPSLPFEVMELEDLAVKCARLREEQQKFLSKIKVTIAIEKLTVQQRQWQEWIQHREFRIGSSVAHCIIARKRNFDTLAKQLSKPDKKLNDLSETMRHKLSHGIKFRSIARGKYLNVIKFELNRKVAVRETGIIIPHHSFWLEASPDGLVCDTQSSEKHGLLEIKCPEGKRTKL